jgi:hypothetical protein
MGSEPTSDDSLALLADAAASSTGSAITSPPAPAPTPAAASFPNPFDQPEEDDVPTSGPFGIKPGYTPNVLTFDYPGAADVDQWLPLCLCVVGFLLLIACNNTADARGFAWIPFVRVGTAGLFYFLITTQLTMLMISKASTKLRFMLPPNPLLRCLGSYMPAFFLITLLQLQGDVFSVSQFFIGALGLVLSSGAVWLFFRLKDENVGTTVMYGAGGFALGAVISLAATFGLNAAARSIVASQHAQAQVPVSPFGQGLAWVAPPPPEPQPQPRVAQAPAASQPAAVASSAAPAPLPTVAPPAPTPGATPNSSSSTPWFTPGTSAAKPDVTPGNPAAPATQNQTVSLGQIEVSTIPGVIQDVIQPIGDAPVIGVVRGEQNATAIECWSTDTWTRSPGTLRLPGAAPGNIIMSADGRRVAWIAEFPRLSIQVWSFTSGSVIGSFYLDRTEHRSQLVAFVGNDQVLLDRSVPKPAGPADPAPPATPKPDTATGSTHWFEPITPAKPITPADQGTSTDGTQVHQMILIDISTGQPVRTLELPMLSAETKPTVASMDPIQFGQNIALSIPTHRLAAAVWKDGAPSILQYDLTTGKQLSSIKISEIDPDQSRMPSALAYNDNGRSLAALFESGGSAILLVYDPALAKKTNSFLYPSGPLEGTSHSAYQGCALCWLDPSPFWCVYGQGIVSTSNGAHLRAGDLSVPEVCSQRQLRGDKLLLISNTPTGRQVQVLHLDRDQLTLLLNQAAN